MKNRIMIKFVRLSIESTPKSLKKLKPIVFSVGVNLLID